MEQFLELAKTYGVQVAVILFFIWRDWQREHSMTARLRDIEDFQRNALAGIIERQAGLHQQTLDALHSNTAALGKVSKTMALCARRSGA